MTPTTRAAATVAALATGLVAVATPHLVPAQAGPPPERVPDGCDRAVAAAVRPARVGGTLDVSPSGIPVTPLDADRADVDREVLAAASALHRFDARMCSALSGVPAAEVPQVLDRHPLLVRRRPARTGGEPQWEVVDLSGLRAVLRARSARSLVRQHAAADPQGGPRLRLAARVAALLTSEGTADRIPEGLVLAGPLDVAACAPLVPAAPAVGDLAAFLGQLLAGRLRTVPARDARTRLMLHSLAGRVAELVPGTAEDVVRAVRELGLRWQAACEADVPLIERLLGERTVVDLTRAVPDLAATGTPRSRPRSSPPLIVLPAGAGGGVSRVVAELVEADRS